MEIKKELHQLSLSIIKDKIVSLQTAIQSIEESRNNETKSSAGDKYETGRAMLHIEEEKSKTQLAKTHELKLLLSEINPEASFDEVALGCLVICTQGKYFISVPIGKVILNDEPYYCISMASPIGVKLRGKKEGEEITMATKTIKILEII